MNFVHSSDLCSGTYEQVLTQAFWYLCRLFFLTNSILYITEPVFLPFLKANSAQKWKKAKMYKSEYRTGNITQWFCRAVKLSILSVKIYVAIMIYLIICNYRPGDVFFAIQVIGNEQFF